MKASIPFNTILYMWTYFNNNPLGKRTGDCVIRALSIALGCTWDEAYLALSAYGFEMKDMPSSNPVWGSFLQENGFRRAVIPNTCPDCYTISDFSQDHPSGLYVVATGTHVVAVNGAIYDSWDSSREVPVYYFYRG